MIKKILLLSLLLLGILNAANITLNKETYKNTENIIVNFTDMRAKHQDWIGIYPKNSSNAWGNVVAWKWTNDLSNGQVRFHELPAGEYEARAFYHNSFHLEAKKAFVVEIDAEEAPTLTTNKATYSNHENIIVNFTDMRAKHQDWIGIYPKNSSNAWGNVVAWHWTEDTTNGQIDFNVLPAGEYEARAFYNNSFHLEAKKAFVVDEVVDIQKPVITLLGNTEVTVTVGTVYADAGATANDNVDGDISNNIVIVNPVDTNVVGVYRVTYNVEDAHHNSAVEATRTVNVIEAEVVDIEKPIITLVGDENITLREGDIYVELNATAIDNTDGNLTANIEIDNTAIDINVPGIYKVTYNVEDNAGNSAIEVKRRVIIIENNQAFTCPATTLTEDDFLDEFVDDNHADVDWSQSAFTPLTVTQIEQAFNVARAEDATVEGNLVMPTQERWDAMSESEKALYLINSARCARGIRPYEGIEPVVVATPANSYANYIATHRADYEANPHEADGRTPWERLRDDAGVIVNTNADFFARGENLAYQSVASTNTYPDTVHETTAKSVYGWMYEDKASTFGHRHFILARGLVENSGKNNIEGLIGLANAKDNYTTLRDNDDGTQTKFYWTRIYTILNGFDPTANWDDNLSNISSVEIQPSRLPAPR